MKKIMCVCMVVVSAIICIYSCKKTSVSETVLPITTDEMAGAKSWLLQQRSSAPDKKWFDSLMSAIDWPKSEVAEFKDNQLLITLPVHLNIWRNFSSKYLSVATNATATQLVLIADKRGGIQSGNLVQLTPTANSNDAGSKASLLNKLFRFSTDNDQYNGYLTVSSVVDTLLYEYKFNNGQKEMYSQRQLKTKTTPTNSSAKSADAVLMKAMTPPATAATCIDWYWTTTWYDNAGNIISQDETYLYTTCNQNTLSSPDDDNKDVNAMLTTVIESIHPISELRSTDIISQEPYKRTVKYSWRAAEGFCVIAHFYAVSYETGVHRYSEPIGQWVWESLTHDRVEAEVLYNLGVSCSAEEVPNTAIAVVRTFSATMNITVKVAVSAIYKGSPIGKGEKMNRDCTFFTNIE